MSCRVSVNTSLSLPRPLDCSVPVSVNTSLSLPRPLDCSVPQGSRLGPWLYLAYTGTLFDVIPPSISVYGFADDHIAHKRFSLAFQLHEPQNIHELEACAV